MPDNTRVPVELKALRTHRDRSLAECAGVLGLSIEGYRLKEKGDSPLTGQELARLAEYFGLPLREAFPSYVPSEDEIRLARHLSAA